MSSANKKKFSKLAKPDKLESIFLSVIEPDIIISIPFLVLSTLSPSKVELGSAFKESF